MKRKLLCICCIISVLSFICITSDFRKTETALASSVLRLHIVANSDSAQDQELKLKVRDRIITETQNLFDENLSISEAKKAASEYLNDIREISRKVIHENGFDYNVNVRLGKNSFPTKEYGNLILPAGTYDALIVEIGKSKGQNWWCVLFPPLCFVDESCVTANADAIENIEESIGKKNAGLINKNKSATIRFKSYEIWQKGKQKLAMLSN